MSEAIICIYALDGQGGGALQEELPQSAKENVWVHLHSDAPDCPELMRGLGLNDIVVDIMTAIESRPRVLMLAEGTLIVLRGINTNEGANPEDMISLRIWMTGNLIITARKASRTLMSIQDIRKDLQDGIGPKNSAEFVVAVTERLADRIGRVVDDVEEQLELIEDDIMHVQSPHVRSNLTLMRRRTAQLKRYLAPQRDALDALYRAKSILDENLALALREQSDRTTRYVEDLDLARERAILLQEELRNQIAEQQNARMYVLSLVTAVFLPLSFLTGVFGMNVMGLPGVENPMGFFLVAGGMTVLAVMVALWMRFRHWL